MICLTGDMVEAFHQESLARFGRAEGLRQPLVSHRLVEVQRV